MVTLQVSASVDWSGQNEHGDPWLTLYPDTFILCQRFCTRFLLPGLPSPVSLLSGQVFILKTTAKKKKCGDSSAIPSTKEINPP